MISNGEAPVSSSEALDDSTKSLEELQLLIRTREGVPSAAFSPDDRSHLEGLIELREDRYVLTRAGRLMANEVSIRLRGVQTSQ
jgi:coproporphyrinogen III oxidase-like Fe-S oxidoreductase